MIDRLQTASYGVQYQAGGASLSIAQLAASAHETLILDPLNVTAADVDTLQAAGKTVILYMSIAETSEFRSWWDDAWTSGPADTDPLTASAPDWIDDPSGASGGFARLVEFWRPEWLEIVKGEIDDIVGTLGADGVFFDNVLSYFEWAEKGLPGTDAQLYSARMVDLVAAASDHAQSQNASAKVIANGGVFLPFDVVVQPFDEADADAQAKFFDAISAIMQEGVFHSGGVLRPEGERTSLLNALDELYLARGIPVLALDYVEGDAAVDQFTELAVQAGLLPYAEELDLLIDGLQKALNMPTSGADKLWSGPNTGAVDGGPGNDTIKGTDAADDIGGGGDDDTLEGGAGNDTLRGGEGEDAAIFAGTFAEHTYQITEREDGGVELATLGGETDIAYSIESFVFSDRTATLAEILPPDPEPDGRPDALSATLATGDFDESAGAFALTLNAAWTLFSEGGAALPAGEIAFSIAPAAGGAAIDLGRAATPLLAAAASDSGAKGLALPLGIAPGDWILTADFDPDGAIAESDETDNDATFALAIPVIERPSPDGRPDALSATLATGEFDETAGAFPLTLNAAWTLFSEGETSLPAGEIAFSLAPAAGGASIDLGRAATPGLAASASDSGAAALALPIGIAPGSWTLTADFDPDDAVGESDETDNADVFAFAIPVIDPPRSEGFFTEGHDSATLIDPGPHRALGGDDTVRGTGEGDTVDGGRGADLLLGRGGADSLMGGGGADAVIGGAGGDHLEGGGGADRVRGGAGRDDLFGGAGSDDAAGGGGDDFLVGGAGRDTLSGGGGADEFKGGGGRDLLAGDGGQDLLEGDGGRDILSGGRGDDTLMGGGGRDEFHFAVRGGHDLVRDWRPGELFVIESGAEEFDDLDITYSSVSGFAASSRIGLPVVSEALVEGDGFSFTVEMPTLYTLRAGDFMFMDEG